MQCLSAVAVWLWVLCPKLFLMLLLTAMLSAVQHPTLQPHDHLHSKSSLCTVGSAWYLSYSCPFLRKAGLLKQLLSIKTATKQPHTHPDLLAMRNSLLADSQDCSPGLCTVSERNVGSSDSLIPSAKNETVLSFLFFILVVLSH